MTLRNISKTTATVEIDRLFRKALSSRKAGGLPEMLNFLRKFRKYSIWNAAMIRLQRPGALAVATENEWRLRGRYVNADAIPIIILQPFGPIRLVYELSDTSPPIHNISSFDPFSVKGKISKKYMEMLVKQVSEKDQIIIEEADYGTLRAGTATKLITQEDLLNKTPYQPSLFSNMKLEGLITNFGSKTEVRKGETRFRIKVARRLELPQRFVTITHELGHIYCGHLGAEKKDPWPARTNLLSKSQRELEAEAVAYLVGSRSGIDLPSADYLSGYVKLEDLDVISIDTIIRAVARIEGLMGKRSKITSSW